ncbi:MAG: hypothetical protein B6D38_00650 [Anaerolineae bacterium UTCFX1]|jgi:hypothetical protein|nr:MAG: hypothetical protein B6D38_00650 [Anaerolineae bacterium UTCFX1]
MKALFKFVALVAFFVIGGGLLVYAASRSLDFVQSTLPVKDQVLGYFALLATSGGMIGWLLVFLYRADGIIQRGTALLMTLIDFIGEAALFTMDTLYRSGENGLVGQMTQDEIRTVILAMSGLIALNIFATLIFELGRMEVLKEIAEGAARDLVLFKALSQIEKDSERVADEMMPDIVEQWRGNFRSAYGSADRLGLGQYQTKDQDEKKSTRKLSFWPFKRDQKSPAELPEPELVPIDNRGNGSKPPEENPT